MTDLDLRLNPAAKIEIRPIGDKAQCAIVDDFLLNPESVRDYAHENSTRFDMPSNSYPGKLLDLTGPELRAIVRFVKMQMSRHFDFLRGGIETMTLLSMTTYSPDQLSNLQRLCHSDPRTKPGRANFAGLLYLFDNESLGGTGFYRWRDCATMEQATALEMQDPDAALEFLQERYATFRKPPCYITESNEIAELIGNVPARFNRFIFYSGDLPHSAYITAAEKLSDDFHQGRLTLNLFASVVPK